MIGVLNVEWNGIRKKSFKPQNLEPRFSYWNHKIAYQINKLKTTIC